MAGRRHDLDEISEKMARADELAASGKTQLEIAQTLGISIMTYHRWRKNRAEVLRADDAPKAEATADDAPVPEVYGNVSRDSGRQSPLAKLRHENAMLRRLLTDLLLEKAELEERLATREARGRRPKQGL